MRNNKIKKNLLPIQKALSLMLQDFKEVNETERVCISKCEGRVLAEDIFLNMIILH